MNSTEESVRVITNKLNMAIFKEIKQRPITVKDIERLGNSKILKMKHKRDFSIQVRKEYLVDYILGIPTLSYSINKYIVADDLMGQHPFILDKYEMVEYINGLLGYDV